MRISYVEWLTICDDIVMCRPKYSKELPVLYYVNSLLVKFIA